MPVLNEWEKRPLKANGLPSARNGLWRIESAADGSATAEEAKRKVEDGKLHTKRQEIDKAKVSLFLLLVFFVGVIVNRSSDHVCC
jgi:hypothetical protein